MNEWEPREVSAAELSPEMLAQAAEVLGVAPEELLSEEPCVPREGALTQEEIYEFADILIKKYGVKEVVQEIPWVSIEAPEQEIRHLVAGIIIDTSMVVDGSVPLERWRDG